MPKHGEVAEAEDPRHCAEALLGWRLVDRGLCHAFIVDPKQREAVCFERAVIGTPEHGLWLCLCEKHRHLALNE